MRSTAITLQIVGILICALGGVGASVVFARLIDRWRGTPDPSLHTMNHFVNAGLELAAVALVVEAAGAVLLVYGSRMMHRAKAGLDD
jgi:hypothetical protein